MSLSRRAALFSAATVLPVAAQRRGGFRSTQEAPPAPKDEAEKKILEVMDHMVQEHKTYLSVPVNDGRWLRLFAESTGARHVAEIGTSTGYSGLWFCLALQRTGGRLSTFELDSGRAAIAKEHFQLAGVDRLVAQYVGDAHQNIRKLKGPIDIAFIDADKEGYPDYLDKVLPLVRTGGLVLAHNVTSSREYIARVTSNPTLETVFYMQGNELGVTLKKL